MVSELKSVNSKTCDKETENSCKHAYFRHVSRTSTVSLGNHLQISLLILREFKRIKLLLP